MPDFADAPELPDHVHSLKDAVQFIASLYLNDHLNFHPDTRFETYVETDGDRAYYTPEEARKRERLRKEAWGVADLYSLSVWVAAWFGFYPPYDLDDAPPELLSILRSGFGRKQDWTPRKKRRDLR